VYAIATCVCDGDRGDGIHEAFLGLATCPITLPNATVAGSAVARLLFVETQSAKRRGGERVDQSEDEILADELAALAAVAGGGGGLTRFVAKLMRKNVHEISLVVPLPFEDAVAHVAKVLERAGRTVDPAPEPGEDQRTIRVVAGGGSGGMNPVVVTALVTKGEASSTDVRVRAAAKEGLIKQRAGEQTAARLATLLAT